jgi:5-formyltetrahydrofolate cyclo-ligase
VRVVDLAARKRALRQQCVGRLRARPPTEAEARAATRLVAATPEFRGATRIALYAALRDELSTRPLEAAARADGKRVALPRILPGGRLELVWVDSFEELRPGRYGVPEPPDGGTTVSLAELDVVIVPGVAFDREGGRLGRGGGYYDRALAARVGRRPFVVGFAQSTQVVDRVPREEFDQPVDAVVTERELIRRDQQE